MTKLTDTSMNFLGPTTVNGGENIPEKAIFWTVRSIVGEFDHYGLGFPLQKIIIGKKPLMFFLIVYGI